MVFDTTREPNNPSNPTEAATYIPYNAGVLGPSRDLPSVGMPIEDDPEFNFNREERCAVVLVLDTSGSMAGTPINSLNEAIQSFHEYILADPMVSTKVDIGIVSFSHFLTWQDFVNANQFQPPYLQADGGTIISFPLDVALDLVTKRKDTYRLNGISYHRPWIILITDGAPEHDNDSSSRRGFAPTAPSRGPTPVLTVRHHVQVKPTDRKPSTCYATKSPRRTGHPKRPQKLTSASCSTG